MRINVNGTDHDIPRNEPITYEAIVSLAGKPGAKGMSVIYHWRGQGDLERRGIIYQGKPVIGDDGMIFNAMFTGNA